MTSNHQKWPNSWDYHISQYCNFYFDDKDIKYLDKEFWTEANTDRPSIKVTAMNLNFQIGEHNYMVGLHRGVGSHFSCDIFYKKIFEPGVEPIDMYVIAANSRYIFVLDNIAGMGGHDMTSAEIMRFAEEIMLSDHNRRNGNDWDNDDDDGENDPIEPFSPTIVAEPELTLV